MTRQERRKHLRQAMEYVAAIGMNPQHGLWGIAAAARMLLDILTGKSPRRASDAARLSVELFDRSLGNASSDPPLACRRGCNFCCHGLVSASAPELFLLARQIREQAGAELPAVIARIREVDGRTRGLDPIARHRLRQPCALLVNGECSVYAARPLSCRAFASYSLEKCEHAFKFGGEDIPVPKFNMTLRSASKQALWSALDYAGLPIKSYELAHGLLVAIETPDAERRWLAGEDVFAGVSGDETESFAGTPDVKLFLEVVGATAMGRDPPPNRWIG
jgi:Fe-S-cluster containining protein